MNTEFENMALLNIEDYNELKAKAEETDEQIKKQAEEMAKPEVVTLKVRFYTYGVSYNPYTCVDVEIPFYNEETEVFIRKRYNMSIGVDPEEN